MAEIWGAALAVGGAVYSADKQSQAAKKAGNISAAGSAAAIAEERRQFDLTRMDTAAARGIGQQALGALGSIYGYNSAPTSTPTNKFLEQTAGAVPLGVSKIGTSTPGGSLNVGGTLVNKLGGAAAIFDPASALLGSKHGDENRNLQAFAAESGAMQLPDGRIALPDGSIFDQSQLKDVAGTWYGAKHSPDGDQAGWQAKFDSLTAGLRGGNAPLDLVQGADGSWSAPPGASPFSGGSSPFSASDPKAVVGGGGYAPTPGGGVDPRMTVGTPGASGGSAGAPDYSNFFASPDFQFRQQQGDQAITRNQAALGGLASGNTGTALTDYSSNLAAGEFGNYFNRQATLAGLGQSATNTSAQVGINTGANIANASQNGANARASAVGTGADAWGNALGTVAGIGYNYFNKPKAIGTGGYGTQSLNYRIGSPAAGSYA